MSDRERFDDLSRRAEGGYLDALVDLEEAGRRFLYSAEDFDDALARVTVVLDRLVGPSPAVRISP